MFNCVRICDVVRGGVRGVSQLALAETLLEWLNLTY